MVMTDQNANAPSLNSMSIRPANMHGLLHHAVVTGVGGKRILERMSLEGKAALVTRTCRNGGGEPGPRSGGRPGDPAEPFWKRRPPAPGRKDGPGTRRRA